MSGSNTAAWQNSNDKVNGLRRVESEWVSSQDVAFAIPDFRDFDIPSDFFSMLPETNLGIDGFWSTVFMRAPAQIAATWDVFHAAMLR
jgi:hypothetical protein